MCKEEIDILEYDREREREIARKRETGRNPTGRSKHSKTALVLLRERKRKRKVVLWLQSEMSSVRASQPEGTNLTVFVCVSIYKCVYLCVFVYVGTVLLNLF